VPERTIARELARLVQKHANDRVRYSDSFEDPDVLLKACSRSIVSKRIESSYRSGKSKDWIKVKCAEWKESNRWRREFFEERR
jgi:bifunctional non-homologous end joining protein LigD